MGMGAPLTWYCPECKEVVAPKRKRVAVVMLAVDGTRTIWAEADATPLSTSRPSLALYHKDCYERWHAHRYGRFPRLRRHSLARTYEDCCRTEHILRAA